MRISRVEVQNFRAIRELDEEFRSLTAFIGYNGGGKSAILRAIDWFFSGYTLGEQDFHVSSGENAKRAQRVRVQVTFSDLTDSDRDVFGPYGRGEEMRLTRDSELGGQTKLYGRPLVCPELIPVRKSTRINEKRALLEDVLKDPKFSGFPDYSQVKTAKDLDVILDEWEADPKNLQLLEERDSEEANHFFGATGSATLRARSNFIFVPAAPDLTAEFQSDVRDSAVSLLTGTLLKEVLNESIASWQSENKEILQDLEDKVQTQADGELKNITDNVNKHLATYLPGTEFELTVGLDDWKPRAQPVAYSSLSHSQRSFGIENHGHGVQRATLLALLQAIAERQYSNAGIDEDTEATPTLIVCIEEPEVYQHPVQARMLAKSFQDAAERGNMQFIYATHSPHFVSPQFLESTFRVAPGNNGSQISCAEWEFGLDKRKDQLSKYFRKSIIDGLFARACLIVEGDTDQFIFDAVKVNGWTLPEHGIAVINADGANSLWTIAGIIASYGVPVHILRDGDSSTARAKHETANEQKALAKLEGWEVGVNRFVEEARVNGLGHGLESFTWVADGQGVYGTYCSILPDDLEAELEQWPSFMRAFSALDPHAKIRNSKQAGLYSLAVETAETHDQPESFAQIFQAVLGLSETAAPSHGALDTSNAAFSGAR